MNLRCKAAMAMIACRMAGIVCEACNTSNCQKEESKKPESCYSVSKDHEWNRSLTYFVCCIMFEEVESFVLLTGAQI
jgi:hypothetical protein